MPELKNRKIEYKGLDIDVNHYYNYYYIYYYFIYNKI